MHPHSSILAPQSRGRRSGMPFKMEDQNNFQVEREQGQQTTTEEGSDTRGKRIRNKETREEIREED